MASLIDLLQWPATAVTLLAAWLVGSTRARRRLIGFIAFILSNLLWIAWGWHDEAWALIVLQVALLLQERLGRAFVETELFAAADLAGIAAAVDALADGT